MSQFVKGQTVVVAPTPKTEWNEYIVVEVYDEISKCMLKSVVDGKERPFPFSQIFHPDPMKLSTGENKAIERARMWGTGTVQVLLSILDRWLNE